MLTILSKIIPRIREAWLLILTSFAFTDVCTQTCGSQTLSTQAAVDNFSTLNCQHIQGNLYIGNEVTDLLPLLSLRTITGELSIAADSIENLQGLNNLESIGTELRIRYCTSLRSLQGLEKLKSVGTEIRIEYNDTLQSVAAFEKLESADNIIIKNNRNLEEVGAFPNLQTIQSNLTITGARIGNIEGFNNLRKAGILNLGSALTESISGFNLLDSIIRFRVVSYPNLKTISGFNQLRHVSQSLEFTNCKKLTTIPAFTNLISLGTLNIRLDSLTSISNFPALTQAGTITIGCNLLQLSPAFHALEIAEAISIYGEQLQQFPSFTELDTVRVFGLGSSLWAEFLPDYSHIHGLEILGISNLKRVKHLNLFNEDIGLRKITITHNESLESLQIADKASDMANINIDSNPALVSINGFNELKTIDSLNITSNLTLEFLPAFENLRVVRDLLFLENLGMQEISGFKNLDSVGNSFMDVFLCGLYIQGMPNLVSFTAFDSLKQVYSFRIQDTPKLDSITGFGMLEYVGRHFWIVNTHLPSLNAFRKLKVIEKNIYIRDNPNISDVSGLDSIDVDKLDRYEVTGNAKLEACNTHWICTSYAEFVPHLFKYNGTSCNSEFDVRQSCDGIYSHIYTEIFYDINQNGIKEIEEPIFPSSRVHILPDSITIFSNQQSGTTFYIPFGNYEVTSSVMDPELWMLTSTTDTFSVSLNVADPGDTLFFGYYPITPNQSVKSFLSSPPQICNEDNYLNNVVKNLGSTIENGILWIRMDEHIPNVWPGSPDFENGELFGYQFQDLFPGQSLNFRIGYTVPGPDAFTIGDSLHFESFIEYQSSADSTMPYQYNPIVRCAYDPNDKLTNPSRSYDQTLLHEDLHYTIRFENTGNLEATNITIIDTLDNDLDLSSIAITSSSHSNRLEASIIDNILTFHFRNIYLPFYSYADSFATQGYVSFSVKPKKPVLAHTIVENSASIYFDLNPPILTNTVRNWFVDDFYLPCTANAGRDTILCVDHAEGLSPFFMGDQPVYAGGTSPFHVSWSADYKDSSNHYTASYFLEDTTANNPFLMNHVDSIVTFYLTVTDSVNIACFDSVRIGFSIFELDSEDKIREIIKGDSVQLFTSVSGGIPPFRYAWSPATGLSDPFIVNPWASPDTTKDYSLLVIDSLGCAITDSFRIIVGTSGIEGPRKNKFASIIKPNPVVDHGTILTSTSTYALRDVSFYNLLGQSVLKLQSDQLEIPVDCSAFENGLYFYLIWENGQLISNGKVVVR